MWTQTRGASKQSFRQTLLLSQRQFVSTIAIVMAVAIVANVCASLDSPEPRVNALDAPATVLRKVFV